MLFLQDTIALILCPATRELSDNMPPLYTDNTLVGGQHTDTVSAIMRKSASRKKNKMWLKISMEMKDKVQKIICQRYKAIQLYNQ